MEVESDGHSDSSETWCIIENPVKSIGCEDGNESDSGVTSVSSIRDLTSITSLSLDDCFELTELSIPCESVGFIDPLGVRNTPCAYDDQHDSEIDTDGISVISEDDELADWKLTAHSNYSTLLHDVSASTHMSNERHFEEPDITIVATPALISDRTLAHIRPSPTSTYLFVTGFVVAFIGYLAMNIFSGHKSSSENVAEILEALDRLRSENDVLRLQLKDISVAYSTLETKLLKDPRSIRSAYKHHETAETDVLSLLMKYSKETANFELMSVIRNLQNLEKVVKKGGNLESELFALGENLLAHPGKRDKLLKVFLEHANKVISRNGNKSNGVQTEKLNIVQWYPENENIDEFIIETDVNLETVTAKEGETNITRKAQDVRKQKPARNNPKYTEKRMKKTLEVKDKRMKQKPRNGYQKQFPKNDAKSMNGTYKMFHNRYKGREIFRKENVKSDWVYDRAQSRRVQRGEGEGKSGHWYFKSFNSRPLNRKSNYDPNNIYLF